MLKIKLIAAHSSSHRKARVTESHEQRKENNSPPKGPARMQINSPQKELILPCSITNPLASIRNDSISTLNQNIAARWHSSCRRHEMIYAASSSNGTKYNNAADNNTAALSIRNLVMVSRPL